MDGWFKARHKWRSVFSLLAPSELGNLMLSVWAFSEDGVEPLNLNEKERLVFEMIKTDILEEKAYKEAVSAKKSEAGRKGGAPKGNRNASKKTSKTSETSTCLFDEKDAENDESKRKEPKENITHSIYINNNTKSDCVEGVQGESEKAAPKQKRFVPPTVDDVKAYITEKGYAFSAERFVAYYESNGWRVGKNPMKDWKAACRTWAGNDYDTPASKPVVKTKVTTEMQYDQRPNTEPDGNSMPQWLVDWHKEHDKKEQGA